MTPYEVFRLVGILAMFLVAVIGLLFRYAMRVERELTENKTKIEELSKYAYRNIPDMIAEGALRSSDIARLFATQGLPPPHVDPERTKRLNETLRKSTASMPVAGASHCQVAEE
jgi:hypothetical protein